MLKLGIPVYEKFDLLDVAGPYEMFTWVDYDKPEPERRLNSVILSEDGNPVTSRNDVQISVHASFAQTPALDVLWVPGGDPDILGKIMSNPDDPYLKYLRSVSAGAKWVCSVCEGALLVARAGLLDGHKATTHWAFYQCLRSFQSVTVVDGYPRFVVSGNRLTGGGISSGLDEALQLILLLFGRETAEDAQLQTQYYPQPPVTSAIPAPPACFVKW
jgi:transcriptional regulator GlxA family with amidase domain